MRLFVGVAIDAAVGKAVADVSDELRQRAAAGAPHARITWVSPDRAHVTLRFIGEVDDLKAAAIGAALEPPLAAGAFELMVSGVGTFSQNGPPRVVLAGLTDGVEAMITVEQEVSARLVVYGVPSEDRPYHPHLTLARVRDAAGLRSRYLLEGLTERTFGSTRVDTITLFQSRLSPKGPTYVPLQTTALRGPTSRLALQSPDM